MAQRSGSALLQGFALVILCGLLALTQTAAAAKSTLTRNQLTDEDSALLADLDDSLLSQEGAPEAGDTEAKKMSKGDIHKHGPQKISSEDVAASAEDSSLATSVEERTSAEEQSSTGAEDILEQVVQQAVGSHSEATESQNSADSEMTAVHDSRDTEEHASSDVSEEKGSTNSKATDEHGSTGSVAIDEPSIDDLPDMTEFARGSTDSVASAETTSSDGETSSSLGPVATKNQSPTNSDATEAPRSTVKDVSATSTAVVEAQRPIVAVAVSGKAVAPRKEESVLLAKSMEVTKMAKASKMGLKLRMPKSASPQMKSLFAQVNSLERQIERNGKALASGNFVIGVANGPSFLTPKVASVNPRKKAAAPPAQGTAMSKLAKLMQQTLKKAKAVQLKHHAERAKH
eukprot:TRINITY_DN11770_c0_g1_i7.p1 TRINITY_DN11770_c0_g1~~TRINITY_DN11770_c0_g1_i7.p1  ORF type:complete len:419 (-),score=83.47 TRINITY_DN11770_c0_g1_i7:26-1231(-)